MRLHHAVDDRQAEARAARAGREERIPRSLEDRRVKHCLREASRGCICPPALPVCACGRTASLSLLTPRALQPSAEEIARNPRARSARLRAAQKTKTRRP